jgi:F-type H+-transporting ATPase subunit b
MHAMIGALVLAAEQVSDKKDIYPKLSELIVGAIAFFILFGFMWKWVLPRVNQILEERRQKIQGDLDKAEEARTQAEEKLADYREQLSGAREEANRVIEEARTTAESIRKEMAQKAEQEYQAIVGRAQEEIRAERDRVFQELRAQVGALSVELAGRIVGESLDRERHLRLVDEYISELGAMSPPNGHAPAGGGSEG